MNVTGDPELLALIAGFRLDEAKPGSFLAPVIERNLPKTFGGQLVAQGLAAAMRTVSNEAVPHSLHCSFLRPGDPLIPVEFEVERLQDGNSFSRRGVLGRQHGLEAFTATASFCRRRGHFDHQSCRALPTRPEDALPLEAWWGPESGEFPAWWESPGPFDVRFDERPVGLAGGVSQGASLIMWLRPAGSASSSTRISISDSALLLAYVSDLCLLDIALHPLGRSWYEDDPIVGASLDHVVWFHEPFEFHDWVSYEITLITVAQDRALVRGDMRSMEGRLLATVMQEGLLWVK